MCCISLRERNQAGGRGTHLFQIGTSDTNNNKIYFLLYFVCGVWPITSQLSFINDVCKFIKYKQSPLVCDNSVLHSVSSI